MMREAEGGKMKGRRRGVSLDAHKHKEEVRSFWTLVKTCFFFEVPQAILLPSVYDGWPGKKKNNKRNKIKGPFGRC
jgi:hypothetical protein